MTTPQIQPLHFATDLLLTLNNDHSIELSPLTLAELGLLIRQSFFSATINDSDALLIAFDQSSHYEHVNFLWFRAFFEKALQQNASLSSLGASRAELARGSFEQTANANFVYVDRVVTSPAARGKGHARLNFYEVGRAAIHNNTKTVRYLLRNL